MAAHQAMATMAMVRLEFIELLYNAVANPKQQPAMQYCMQREHIKYNICIWQNPCLVIVPCIHQSVILFECLTCATVEKITCCLYINHLSCC